jgi:AcrR family transcriptional regulator
MAIENALSSDVPRRGSGAPAKAKSSGAPRGREETKRAVMEAAAELFADRSPSRVTIREIAAKAGVNHALVHRHFGTKKELLRAVIQRGTLEYSERINEINDPAEAFRAGFLFGAEDDPAAATLARAVLDGSLRGRPERAFPGMARHIALLDGAIDATGAAPRHAVRVIAACAFAFMGGWFILEDWLVPAAGLSDRDVTQVRDEVANLLKDLVSHAAGLDARALRAVNDPDTSG